ncbi:hypothetical protein BRADI_1g36752v3 [Brachypodium distachyon]|uniref:Uncharacterized protein n=1 Tax=Brachypodium distachyon TaxID=15368 RepID=A0A2K2DN51_BRADI|nr:hypothetical protein BRADI_1g36752v3 [Brachypodium distachyon]
MAESGESSRAATSAVQHTAAAAVAPMPTTGQEVISGVKIPDAQHTANADGGSLLHTGDQMMAVAQLVPSFSLDSSGDQVAASNLLVASDKTMQASAGSTSTMGNHGSISIGTMLTGSATTSSPAKVQIYVLVCANKIMIC